ncbi:response regulator transcription factor [Cryptosporangium phraense]|uniref:Response regulator transcription factor n=1 Tax=Cryptosporangium phraense TaxID=2593070 RepID=A0A545AZI6_9ACTN|nr:response regulator transcription factor [Cryptosporangium phraense]TQS46750.1 response regulator transcription factor [Cryptosporangium phraense]
MTNEVSRVLVVDDETALAELVAMALRYEGYRTAVTGSVRGALTEVGRFRPDLIVLDVVLPDGSGVDACARLRRGGTTAPVIFLTARYDVRDRIAGLDSGGDDYLTKPFSLDELVARVRAVLRRSGPSSRTLLACGDLEIDEDAYEVRRGGVPVTLTPTEFRLLRYLAANAGRVLSKAQILDHVWGGDFGASDNTVQTYVSYLRRKLDPLGPPLLHTVARVGYAMRPPP